MSWSFVVLQSLGNVNVNNASISNSTVFGYSISPQEAGNIISLFDLGYSLLFLLFSWYWGKHTASVIDYIDEEVTLVSDYAVIPRVLLVLPYMRGSIHGGTLKYTYMLTDN